MKKMGSKAVQLTEEQLDTLTQNQLDKLQKAFRLMESDKEAYSEEIRRNILKQKTVISHFEEEKKELETLLACGDNKLLKKKEEDKVRLLQRQLKEYEEIEFNIKKEGLELKELEFKVGKVEREVMDFKSKYHLQETTIESVKKQTKTEENLETRLNVETIKFNKLISENQVLRQEIDHLLIERGKFNLMFQQLVGKLNSGKKILMDLIEQSTMAYDKREEAVTKLEALRSRARQDLIQHSQEMRELKRRLDNETKLHDFVGAKGTKRINVDLEGTVESKREKIRQAKEFQLQEYKRILDGIKIYFRESDVDRMIASYMKIEEDNFNLFSFINELNKQMGVLQQQLCETRERIDEQREKNIRTGSEQVNNLMKLQDELVVRTQEVDEALSKLKVCQEIVNSLLEGLNAAFKMIQCDPTPVLSLLGPNSTATVNNFDLYLDILEKRVIDIVNLTWYLTNSRVAVRAAKLYPGQVSSLREPIMKVMPTTLPKLTDANKYIPSQPCPLCTQKEDISEVDESIATPLEKEEIVEALKEVLFSPEYEERVHNVKTDMARKKNLNSEDLEMDQMARAELARLQRQYRIMEGDREAYSEEVKILLQKQRKTIEILEKEKKELLANLNCAKCPANEAKTEKNAEKLKQLLLLHDKMNKDITYEQTLIKELDIQINKMEKELEGLKQKSGIKSSAQEEVEDQIRAQQQLENRLDVATVKLNRLLASNHKLREEIDHFLKQRTSFNQLFQELTNRLQSGKKIIMDLMDQSTTAYDQREEAQAKLEALKQKGKHDVLVHSQETKELQRKLDHDTKLHEFLGIKGQKRVMADLEAKEALKKQQQKEALEQQIQTYQSLLDQIKKISEETDVDRLAAQFVKQEEENFALFNYVNELNNEVLIPLEVLQEQVDEVKKNVEEQKQINAAKALQKQAALETLQTELEERKLETKETEENMKECQEASEKLFKGIQIVFELLKADANPVLQLLGETTTVTTFNVSLYLGIIEKRAKELTKLVENWERVKKENEKSTEKLLQPPTTPSLKTTTKA